MNTTTYPSFIVGGGVRCATGWIRECLSEHPEIYMEPKETHYFDQNYEKGDEWYKCFFQDHTDKKIKGEKTASYLHINNVVAKIKETVPDVKLVFSLRDPVDRMYSHYTMSASTDKTLLNMGFEKAVEEEKKFLNWGKYSEQLKDFYQNIPENNIHIVIFEEIQENPHRDISEIYRFIGANPDFKAPSTQLRTKLGKFEHENPFWGGISTIMLHPRAPFFLRSIYTQIRPKETKKKLPDKHYRRFSDYFREDIQSLEELLGRDLSIWPTRRYV